MKLDSPVYGLTVGGALDAYRAVPTTVGEAVRAMQVAGGSLADVAKMRLDESLLGAARRFGLMQSVTDLSKQWAELSASTLARDALRQAGGSLGSSPELALADACASVSHDRLALAGTLLADRSLRGVLEQASASKYSDEVRDLFKSVLDHARSITDVSGGSSIAVALALADAKAKSQIEDALTGSRALQSLAGAIEAMNRAPMVDWRSAGTQRTIEQALAEAAGTLRSNELPALSTADADAGLSAPIEESIAQFAQQLDREVQAFAQAPMTEEAALRISVLVAVMVALFQLLLTPAVDFYAKRWLEEVTRDRKEKREIVQAAREVVPDLRLLDGYRFVPNASLQLRAAASSKARVVASLPAGSAVRLVEVSGAFSLVEWEDVEEKSSVRGWAFSRYLSKFR